MKREEAKMEFLENHHSIPFGEYGIMLDEFEEIINKLYDEFENKSCNSCKSKSCDIRRILIELKTINPDYFSCNDWESK